VLGSLVTLRQHGARLDPAKRDLLYEMGERQALKLRRLIEDLLLVAATDAGLAGARAEEFDVAALLRGVASSTLLTCAPTVVIEDGAPAVITTDPARVRQVLDALLDNAAKFAPGSIEVVASASAAGIGGLQLAVRDHGPGIPAPDRDRIFERFVQLDQSATRRHGGTGIGLYLSTKLAELLSGSLRVEETPGGGATFVLVLPELELPAVAPLSARDLVISA
jgi:signal transduction histidine kinase